MHIKLRPPFPEGATIMGYRTSKSLLVFTFIGCGILAFIFLAALYLHDYLDLFGVCFVLGGILILMHLQQLGYRVAWDKQGVYVRRWGIFNALNLKSEITSVPWETILGFTTSLQSVFGRDWDYEPNEFLEIHFGRGKNDLVRVYPYMIDMRNFEEFARFFSTKMGKSIELE